MGKSGLGFAPARLAPLESLAIAALYCAFGILPIQTPEGRCNSC